METDTPSVPSRRAFRLMGMVVGTAEHSSAAFRYSLRHRVESAADEGMASQQAPDRESRPTKRAVPIHRFKSVFRTSWRVTAGGKK